MESNSSSKKPFRSIMDQKRFTGFILFFLAVSNSSVLSKENDVNIAYYDEIKDLPNNPDVLLIDVREPNELEETGRIPTSINIPLASVEQALSNKTSSEKFNELYGREKPEINSPLIFSCRSGRRSLMAYRKAETLGYTNIKNYQGSWLEWAERENLPSK